jgi:hypothetical protein
MKYAVTFRHTMYWIIGLVALTYWLYSDVLVWSDDVKAEDEKAEEKFTRHLIYPSYYYDPTTEICFAKSASNNLTQVNCSRKVLKLLYTGDMKDFEKSLRERTYSKD